MGLFNNFFHVASRFLYRRHYNKGMGNNAPCLCFRINIFKKDGVIREIML
jgi:hypothetical protein